MVRFDHRDAGTDEAAWEAAGVADLPSLTPRTWAPGDTLLVAVAHPDDETLGAAGLIRAALRGGADVHVALATAGEASHPDSPTHTPADLVRLRRTEMDHAVAALADGLGPEAGTLTWESLGLPDGDLAARPAEVRAALERVLAERTAGDGPSGGAPEAGAGGAVVLVSHDPDDGHGDHDTVGAAAAALAAEHDLELYAFPLWFWHWGAPEELRPRRYRRLDLAPGDAEARRAALDAHASQTRPLSAAPGDEAILPARMIAHFSRGFETFRRTAVDDGDASRASAVFDRLYRAHDDPWHYLTSPYEARKRALTLAVLPRPRYGTVVEAGASIGVLTAALAERAERVVGLEASQVAVERAAAHLADVPHAEVRLAVLPADWPADLGPAGEAAGGPDDDAGAPVDLVVASEIGYFLQPEELDALVDAADASLGPGGELLLCHWRQPITGWPLDGDAVHDRVAADPRWRLLSEHVEADLRLSVHTRAAAATHAVVVVPAKDEAEHLPDSLAGLSAALDHWEAQHTQGSAAAVVAVPDDDTPTLAAARAARSRDPRIHVLELGPGAGGVGRARAEAARHARGLFPDVPAAALWLACTDADTRVPADWLVGQPALAARRRADGQAMVLGTVDLPAHADQGLVRSWRADYEHREDHPHVHGANLGLPWALYERVGGFAAVAEHEDVRLAEAVRALGEDRVLATDRVRVHTSSRLEGRTPGGFAGFLRDLLEEASAEG
ncbi:bifunctional PIG-L family deacetylase/class I SAM-dependent methyltransferase [Micrococcus flavus]|uniref:4,4'-diaponeurosporenoate glycosyltransferase n=3 Tax=Micrococcus flavus TaxID=384602 RepID=A0A7W7L580_9MICC|nr:bifunctional PIG-L family deacetylase/class I SAM-dependent methyltransferase [Micrococcus flavus]MBB4883739.1 LmbE family N-acetylglucosaminyl deacetylase/methylase of polypeptide subunit release factors [Micrococcus flavus]GGK47996.1 hypothetical protein GCM10007073_13860 [Micrococcus flavus]